MASPTKINTGNDRPVARIDVINAEDRTVERQQLNRILSSLSQRIDAIPTSGSSGGSSGGVGTVSANPSQISVIVTGDDYYLEFVDSGVTTNILAALAVSTAKIANNAVTFAKIQTVATDRLIGRDTAGTGNVEEISLGSTLAWSGSGSFGINLNNANTWTATQTFSSIIVNDNTTLGSSNSDTINVVGRFSSGLDPATDNTYDLGRTGHEWRNLYIDGVAYIDDLRADVATIGTLGGYLTGTSGVVGAVSTIPATDITSSTTVGRNLLTATNPSAVTFIRANADNSVSFLSDSDFRTAIGAAAASALADYVTLATTQTVSGAKTFSANTGIGALSTDWLSSRRALQIGGSTVAALSLGSAVSEVLHNLYASQTLSTLAYTADGPAGVCNFNNQVSGGWSWRGAATGTAGTAASLVQWMQLTSIGLAVAGTKQNLTSISDFNMGLIVEDSTAQAAGVGGGVSFRGNRTDAGVKSTFAAIDGFKEDGTSGNYLGALRFLTANNSTGYPEERARIDSSGNMAIGTTTANEKVTVNGGLSIVDGMTAPSATSGYAKIYVNSSNGDLEVIFGDGTVKTIVTDT
jgi:hypothetical protein